jgi:hypothetical protein
MTPKGVWRIYSNPDPHGKRGDRKHTTSWIKNEKQSVCKTSTVPILMQKMHISTNYVYSVMLKPNYMKIQNNYKAEKKQRNKTDAIKWSQIH